jgi:hypothetical protein
LDRLRANAAKSARLAAIACAAADRQAAQLRQAKQQAQHAQQQQGQQQGQQQQEPLQQPNYQQIDPALLQHCTPSTNTLQMSQTHTQQLHHNQQQVIKTSLPSFPVWTGSYEDLEVHMELLHNFKKSAYFANVHNWATKDPCNVQRSRESPHPDRDAGQGYQYSPSDLVKRFPIH